MTVKTMMLSYLVVAGGGALGAMARFALSLWLQRGTSFPWGTLSSNLLGCLVMGVLAHLATHVPAFNTAGPIPDHYRLLFAVGFCGSFTTLSSLVLEISELLGKGQAVAAFAYFCVTMIGGFAAFWLGYHALRPLTG